MIIENVPYVPLSEKAGYTMSASLAMILGHYISDINEYDVNEEFGHILLSDEFHNYFTNSLEKNASITGSEVLECANFMLNKLYPDINSSIVTVDIAAIRYSFIKRDIPVITCGCFPITSGYVPGSIVIKGYVGDYFIVNDPRGNARSGYKDRLGENQVYHISELIRWHSGKEINILRIMR